jgi:hypothetical protein
MLNVAYHYPDLLSKGRDDAGHEFPQFWLRRHAEYSKRCDPNLYLLLAVPLAPSPQSSSKGYY